MNRRQIIMGLIALPCVVAMPAIARENMPAIAREKKWVAEVWEGDEQMVGEVDVIQTGGDISYVCMDQLGHLDPATTYTILLKEV